MGGLLWVGDCGKVFSAKSTVLYFDPLLMIHIFVCLECNFAEDVKELEAGSLWVVILTFSTLLVL